MSLHEGSSSKGVSSIHLPPPGRFDIPTSKGITNNCKFSMVKLSLKFTSTANKTKLNQTLKNRRDESYYSRNSNMEVK